MNLRKLMSLALASLMGLNVFSAELKTSAKDMSLETISETTAYGNNNLEPVKKEVKKGTDLKKEAEKLKNELPEHPEKNKSLKPESTSFKTSIFGKLISKIIKGTVASASWFLVSTGVIFGTEFGNKFVNNMVSYTTQNRYLRPDERDEVRAVLAGQLVDYSSAIVGLLATIVL